MLALKKTTLLLAYYPFTRVLHKTTPRWETRSETTHNRTCAPFFFAFLRSFFPHRHTHTRLRGGFMFRTENVNMIMINSVCAVLDSCNVVWWEQHACERQRPVAASVLINGARQKRTNGRTTQQQKHQWKTVNNPQRFLSDTRALSISLPLHLRLRLCSYLWFGFVVPKQISTAAACMDNGHTITCAHCGFCSCSQCICVHIQKMCQFCASEPNDTKKRYATPAAGWSMNLGGWYNGGSFVYVLVKTHNAHSSVQHNHFRHNDRVCLAHWTHCLTT